MVMAQMKYLFLSLIHICKKDKDDAVVIAALHKPSNKLVLIKQFRIPVNDYVYEVPAGLIDEGEEAKSSVIRELKEETGLTVTKIIEKGKGNLYLSPGMTDESVSLVYCICEGCISTESLEDDECIEPMLISKEEAKEIMYSNNKDVYKRQLQIRVLKMKVLVLKENLQQH